MSNMKFYVSPKIGIFFFLRPVVLKGSTEIKLVLRVKV